MKKFVFITGALAFSLTSLGILFKIQHWPLASVFLTIGIAILALVFVPGVTKYLYDKEK